MLLVLGRFISQILAKIVVGNEPVVISMATTRITPSHWRSNGSVRHATDSAMLLDKLRSTDYVVTTDPKSDEVQPGADLPSPRA